MNELEHFPLDWTLYLIDNDAGVILTNPVNIVFKKIVSPGLDKYVINEPLTFKFIVNGELKVTHLKMVHGEYSIYFKAGLEGTPVLLTNLHFHEGEEVHLDTTYVKHRPSSNILQTLESKKELWL